jgi:hypothetical protein
MGTRLQSPMNLLAGICCLAGTLVVLYGHVRGLDDLALEHMWIAVALIVACVGGYNMNRNMEARNWLGVFLFGLLFVVGTGFSVGLSASRSVVIMDAHEKDYNDEVNKKNGLQSTVTSTQAAMEEAKRAYVEAKRIADDARSTAAKECNTGDGTQCKGTAKSLSFVETPEKEARLLYEKKQGPYQEAIKALRDFKEPSPPNPTILNFAKMLAAITDEPLSHAQSLMKYLFPLCVALISEFGTIMFLHEAFAPRAPAPVRSSSIESKTVGIAQIAHTVGMTPQDARKRLRQAREPRPVEGWVWEQAEAQRIKNVLLTSQASASGQAS